MFNEGAGVTRTTDMSQLVVSHYFLIMFLFYVFFAVTLIWFLWDVKEPTPLFKMSRGHRPSVVDNFHTSHHSHHGLGGYRKLINGLRVAASGPFVC